MQPGQFKPPGDEGWVVRKLQDLERAVQQLAAANPFKPMGVVPVAGGFAVTGTLDLPSGIITNDALAAPVVISQAGISQNNFATTTTATVYATATVTVPAGYSKADVQCMVVAGAANSTASLDYIYVAASINGIAGAETPQTAVASGGYASAGANGTRTLTGLNGGTITVGCQIRTGTAWAANTSNIANMNAAVFFRK